MTDETTYYSTIAIRLVASDKELLRALAKMWGLSQSQTIRRALREAAERAKAEGARRIHAAVIVEHTQT